MLIKVRDRVQTLIDAGKTEDESPSPETDQDLDAVWARPGAWLTGDKAVRMAYQSLKGIKPPAAPGALSTPGKTSRLRVIHAAHFPRAGKALDRQLPAP